MGRNTDQQKIYNAERAAGRKAAKIAESYVLSLLRQKLNIRNEGSPDQNIKPLLKTTSVKAKMGEYRLLGLNFRSSKVGFIQHYGFMGVRDATTVLLSHSRYEKTATKRGSSKVEMPGKNFFENIYQKSGAMDFLLKALAETRTDAIKVKIHNITHALNLDENGSK